MRPGALSPSFPEEPAPSQAEEPREPPPLPAGSFSRSTWRTKSWSQGHHSWCLTLPWASAEPGQSRANVCLETLSQTCRHFVRAFYCLPGHPCTIWRPRPTTFRGFGSQHSTGDALVSPGSCFVLLLESGDFLTPPSHPLSRLVLTELETPVGVASTAFLPGGRHSFLSTALKRLESLHIV